MSAILVGVTIGILSVIVQRLFKRAVEKAVRSEIFDVTHYLFDRADHLWDNKTGTSAPFEIEKAAWDIRAGKHKPEKK